MTIDQLARHIHRRGVLAALAALAIPTQAGAQFAQCAGAGEGCTLLVRCCSGDCVTLPTNPNAGVCGGRTIDDGDDRDVATCAELSEIYDVTGDDDISCNDFECWEDAQDFLDLYPHDPCRLDEGGDTGIACEHLPDCSFQRTSITSQRRQRRRRRLRQPRRTFR